LLPVPVVAEPELPLFEAVVVPLDLVLLPEAGLPAAGDGRCGATPTALGFVEEAAVSPVLSVASGVETGSPDGVVAAGDCIAAVSDAGELFLGLITRYTSPEARIAPAMNVIMVFIG